MVSKVVRWGALFLVVMACGCAPNWTIHQTITPEPVQYGRDFTATCKVGGDLKQVGWVMARPLGAGDEYGLKLKDDGTEGDKQAGDGVFALTSKVPAEAENNRYEIEFVVYNQDGEPMQVPSFTVVDKDGKVVKEETPPKPEEGKKAEMVLFSTISYVTVERWGLQYMTAPDPIQIGKKFTAKCTVTGNLAKIGRVSATPMAAPEFVMELKDDGKNGDEQAGDGVFTAVGEAPLDAEPGEYEVEFVVYDKKGEPMQVPFFELTDKAGESKDNAPPVKDGKMGATLEFSAVVSVKLAAPPPPPAKKKPAGAWSIQPKLTPDPVKIGKKFVATCKLVGDLKKVGWVSAVPIVAPEFTMEMKDNGKEGDKKAGDGIFTITGTPPEEAEPGIYEIEFVVYDKNGDPLEVPAFNLMDKNGKVAKKVAAKKKGEKVEFSSIVTVTIE